MQSLKDKWQELPPNTQKVIKLITVGTIVLAAGCLLAFNFLGKNKEYSTLFTGLNQEEAQEVVALLQDENTDYRYNSNSGSIQVPETMVDEVRAGLLSKGYPQSGFTYDMYRNNAGLMTTESDKKQYTLYELQDRLGSQIRLFDGVKDAKVTIAEAANQRYALEDSSQTDASASVVVTMDRGAVLTPDKAAAIKNLIARAVKGMHFTNVSVFDAATMLEVDAASSGEGDAYGNTKEMTSLANLIENNIAANIRRVLEQLYGNGNVAVSVKGTLNTEKLIQENTQYTVPEQVDEENRTGLLSKEDLIAENIGNEEENAGGVAGADANADVPRYQYNPGSDDDLDKYSSIDRSREWLFNTLKEQKQVDPGVLEDTTVGVVILTSDTTSVSDRDLLNLVANSAGIPLTVADQKITIIRAEGPAVENNAPAIPAEPVSAGGTVMGIPIPFIIAAAAAVVLLILLLLLTLLGRRKKKKEQELYEMEAASLPPLEDGGSAGGNGFASMPSEPEEPDEVTVSEELLNLRMQRNLRLKQSIGDFVDQNPQIAAKLIQGWLRGEEQSSGRPKDGKN